MLSIEDKLLIGSGVTLCGSMIFIGGTLAIGIMTGLMSSMGLGIILIKLKDHFPMIWRLICSHPIAADFLLSSGLFMLVASSTATGIIAGASASLFTSLGLTFITRNKLTTEEAYG